MISSITICMGSSCFCRGNEENAAILEEFLAANNLNVNVRLLGHRCQQLCKKGPVISFDDETHYHIDENKLRALLEKYFAVAVKNDLQ